MSAISGGPSASEKEDSPIETPNQLTKKRKMDMMLSPVKISNDPEIQKTVDDQLKLKTHIQKIMAEVDGLRNTLGSKAKTETKGFTEKLYLLVETIREDNLLESLGLALERQSSESVSEQGEIMDLDNTKQEILCTRCKKEILDEKQLTETIRSFVEECHVVESPVFRESDLAKLNQKWPEEAFIKTNIKTGNPLQEIDGGDVLLVLKTKEDNPYILGKFEERHTGLKDIVKDELVDGQIQFLENITKTKSGVQKRGRVYVMSGKTPQMQMAALKELEKEISDSEGKKISIIAADETLRTNVRKLMEIIFIQTNIDIDVYVPKKEIRGKLNEPKYDTVVISSSAEGKTYSDMLKVVRENIDPDNLGINVKSLRKRKDDSLLIVTEKHQMNTLKKVILENENMKDIRIVDKRCDLLVTGLDAVTTTEEVLEAIKDAGELSEDEMKKTTIKSIYTNRSGEQVATITTIQDVADKVITAGNVKIGWSRCRIKEKVSVPRCSNCLRIGHLNKNCKSRNSEGKKCLNCTQVGHEVKDCENKSHCNSCAKDGHRADSMSCPKYRKMVYEKERSLTS